MRFVLNYGLRPPPIGSCSVIIGNRGSIIHTNEDAWLEEVWERQWFAGVCIRAMNPDGTHHHGSAVFVGDFITAEPEVENIVWH